MMHLNRCEARLSYYGASADRRPQVHVCADERRRRVEYSTVPALKHHWIPPVVSECFSRSAPSDPRRIHPRVGDTTAFATSREVVGVLNALSFNRWTLPY